jgi:hypothetical protein
VLCYHRADTYLNKATIKIDGTVSYTMCNQPPSARTCVSAGFGAAADRNNDKKEGMGSWIRKGVGVASAEQEIPCFGKWFGCEVRHV